MISYLISKFRQLISYINEVAISVFGLKTEDSAAKKNQGHTHQKLFSPKYQHYSKGLTIKHFGYILGVLNQFDSDKFNEIKVFSDYSKLKEYIENIIKNAPISFSTFPILYRNKYSTNHFSALVVSISESKVNFVYFDSIGFDNNLKDFFKIWSSSVTSSIKGVFAGHCPINQSGRKMQNDGSSCGLFSTLFLFKASKCKSVQELFSYAGVSDDRILESKKLEKLCEISKDVSQKELFDCEFYSLIRESTSSLACLAPCIVKYAQTNLYDLKDFNISKKLELFLQEHTFSVNTSYENGELLIKKYSKAIWDFRSKLLSICHEFVHKNQVDEDLILGKYLNNSNYSLAK